MSVTFSKIAELPRYRRLPGQYFAVQNDGTMDRTADICWLLGQAGIQAVMVMPQNSSQKWDVSIQTPGQWRAQYLERGDYATFRRDLSRKGGWSVITYKRKDFETRFQKVGA